MGLSLLQRIFPTWELNRGLLHAGRFFTNLAVREAPSTFTPLVPEAQLGVSPCATSPVNLWRAQWGGWGVG